jgi:hypothetical protein
MIRSLAPFARAFVGMPPSLASFEINARRKTQVPFSNGCLTYIVGDKSLNFVAISAALGRFCDQS